MIGSHVHLFNHIEGHIKIKYSTYRRPLSVMLPCYRSLFPGKRSDRSKRSDRYSLFSGLLLCSGNARSILKVAISSDYIPVSLIYKDFPRAYTAKCTFKVDNEFVG